MFLQCKILTTCCIRKLETIIHWTQTLLPMYLGKLNLLKSYIYEFKVSLIKLSCFFQICIRRIQRIVVAFIRSLNSRSYVVPSYSHTSFDAALSHCASIGLKTGPYILKHPTFFGQSFLLYIRTPELTRFQVKHFIPLVLSRKKESIMVWERNFLT